MNWDGTPYLAWLVRTALGGSLLLLLTWSLLKVVRQPARRQRLAEGGVLAALTVAVLNLAPTWLVVSVPSIPEPLLPAVTALEPPRVPPAAAPMLITEDTAEEVGPETGALAGPAWLSPEVPGEFPPLEVPFSDEPHRERALAPTNEAISQAAPPASDSFPRFSVHDLALGILGLYLAGAATFLGRWLLGYVGLWRLLRTATAPPALVVRVFAAMTRNQPGRPRLRMSRRLRVPVSCGLFQPTVVLPAGLCESGPDAALRWVLAHELTHLRRRDPWSCLLFALAAGVFYYCPWFWWLRRQVRLCQEYVADAAAVDADARTEDYAQFLLDLATAPAGPRLAIGVLGRSSDLFRRVTMLLQAPQRVDIQCPRLWTLVMTAGLLAVAVLTSGVGLQAADPAPKDGDQQEEPKKPLPIVRPPAGRPIVIDEVEIDPTSVGAVVDLVDLVQEPPETLGAPGGRDAVEALQKALDSLPKGPEMERVREELRKAIERLKERRQAVPGLPGAGRPRATTVLVQSHGHRLGVHINTPSAALADQLDLPKGQGIVITQVLPDSAAAKAGLKANDIVLELNGKKVSSDPQEFARMVDEIKAKKPVEVVVLRKGKEETVKGLSLPEAPARPRGRAVPALPGLPGQPAGPGLPPGAAVPAPLQPPAAGARPGARVEAPEAPALPRAPGQPGRPDLPPGAAVPVPSQPPAAGARPGAPAPAPGPGGVPVLPPAPRTPGALRPPAVEAVPPGGGGANNFVMTSVFRTNDRFTTRHQEGNLVITLTGSVTDGKAKVSEIHVQDGNEAKTYKSVDKVPERYADKVKNLIEMSEKGRVKVESRSPQKR